MTLQPRIVGAGEGHGKASSGQSGQWICAHRRASAVRILCQHSVSEADGFVSFVAKAFSHLCPAHTQGADGRGIG